MISKWWSRTSLKQSQSVLVFYRTRSYRLCVVVFHENKLRKYLYLSCEGGSTIWFDFVYGRQIPQTFPDRSLAELIYLPICGAMPNYLQPTHTDYFLLHTDYSFVSWVKSWVSQVQKIQAEIKLMMTSSNGNIFRVTGHLCGEFTGPRLIPRTKASDEELWCFLWSASE